MPRMTYDEYLDDMHENGMLDLSVYRGSQILKEVDPIAYDDGEPGGLED